MIIEMQIRASQFAAGFRERMRRELSCRVMEFNIGSEAFMAIGFDVGNTVFRHGVQASAVACVRGQNLLDQHKVNHRALQLVQTLHANVCSRDNLIAANAAPCPTFQLHLDLVFEIAMDSCTWFSDLVFTFVGVDGINPNTELVQTFTAQMPPSRHPFPSRSCCRRFPASATQSSSTRRSCSASRERRLRFAANRGIPSPSTKGVIRCAEWHTGRRS